MQRPRHGGEGVLGLFDEDEPPERTAASAIPECIYCAKATLRTGAAGRPAPHARNFESPLAQADVFEAIAAQYRLFADDVDKAAAAQRERGTSDG